MRIRKLGLVASLLSLAALLSACHASHDSDLDGTAGKLAPASSDLEIGAKTRSFEGTFVVASGKSSITWSFQVSNIDLGARTARFSARAIDNPTGTRVTEDKNVPTTIVPYRDPTCEGCSFSFEAVQDANALGGRELAWIFVTRHKLDHIKYSGIAATDVQLTSAVDGTETGTGTCTLSCNEIHDCVDGATADTCNPQLFRSIPRCPFEIAFAADTTCPR